MKLITAVIFSAFMATSALAYEKEDDKSGVDVKQGVERVQYDWTKLHDKDKSILKESSDLEKNAQEKLKNELSEYRKKTDELYQGLSDDAKNLLRKKSKLYKSLSSKGKKLLDQMYFLIKRGVTTFHMPGIDEVMPKVHAREESKHSEVPIVEGKPVSEK